MKVYKFTSEKYGLENLIKRQLKVSKPIETNDPFEMAPFQFDDTETRKLYRKIFESHTRNKGFISFSKNHNSPSMWANYAENHRGMCLGFEVTEVARYTKRPQRYLREVKYVDRFRPFDTRALNAENVEVLIEEIDYAMATKSSHWQYEEELRMFTGDYANNTHGKLTFLPFGPSLRLSEVILGWKCELTQDNLLKQVGEDPISIWIAEPSTTEFAMTKKKAC